MKKKTKKVNSHVIAQTYLREFSCSKSKICQYDIRTDKDEEIPYKRAGAIKNYFAFWDDAKKLHSAESLFNEIAESDYKMVVEKIRKNKDPNQTDMESLKAFLTLQILKPKKQRDLWEKSSLKFTIPSIQENLKNDPEFAEEIHNNLIKNKQFDGTVNDLIKEILDLDGTKIKMEKNYKNYFGTLTILQLYKSVYSHISTLNPRFLFNKGSCPLITSDHPYFIYSEGGADELSLGLNGDAVYMPLASDVLAILSSNSVKNILDADRVNQEIVNAAERFVFHDRHKSVGDYVKYRVPTMVYTIEEGKDSDGARGIKITRKRN